jgi:hypothetical protein
VHGGVLLPLVKDVVSCRRMAVHRRDLQLHMSLLPLLDGQRWFGEVVKVGGIVSTRLLEARNGSGRDHQ